MSVEAPSVQFSPQELLSLDLVQSRYSPDGSHDDLNVPEESVEKAAPFAFDLGREYQLAQEYGQNYQRYFLDNAHYYAKESYGKVPTSEYEHEIVNGKDGGVALYFGNGQGAYESYLKPAFDPSKPEWYQRRSRGDVRWVVEMERELEDANEGDMFVDLSPTEFNVSVEERQEWGYGSHSFVRLHKVVCEGGSKKLISTAIRNYLDAPEQETLMTQLTGEHVPTYDMLGNVKKINTNISKGYVRVIADRLYDNTPQERKIIPPAEYMNHIKSELEMDDQLERFDVWLSAVYEMMERGESPAKILMIFRGWENAVKDFTEGEKDFSDIEEMTVGEMLYAIYRNDRQITDFTDRQYEPGASGCGLGSGFTAPERTKDGMSYESMTKTTEGECPEIKCKKCPWKADAYEVDKITKGTLKKCPKCGWKP